MSAFLVIPRSMVCASSFQRVSWWGLFIYFSLRADNTGSCFFLSFWVEGVSFSICLRWKLLGLMTKTYPGILLFFFHCPWSEVVGILIWTWKENLFGVFDFPLHAWGLLNILICILIVCIWPASQRSKEWAWISTLSVCSRPISEIGIFTACVRTVLVCAPAALLILFLMKDSLLKTLDPRWCHPGT